MTVSLDGLHPTLMRPRVEATLADPRAVALRLYVVSAFRSIERQRQLFEAAVKKYGSVKEARKWVAPPGTSNHGPKVEGYGTAVDFGMPGVHADENGHWPPHIRQQVDAICADHGLASPMQWEDWHYEPIAGWTPPAPQPARPRVPQEDDMPPIANKTVVDTHRCFVADCPGWFELEADGGVTSQGQHTGDHFQGSYFDDDLADLRKNNPQRMFLTIANRRDGRPGYTLWANDGAYVDRPA